VSKIENQSQPDRGGDSTASGGIAKNLDRLSSPEELEDLLAVVTPRVVLAIVFLILALGAAGVWAFFGEIPLKVEGRCIVLNERGLFEVQSEIAGIIHQVTVQPGDTIEEGNFLMALNDSNERLKLRAKRDLAEELKRKLDDFKAQINREWTARKQALESDIQARRLAVLDLQKDLIDMRNRVEGTRGLLREGLVSAQSLELEEQAVRAKERELRNTSASIDSLQSELAKGYRAQEYKEKELRYQAVNDEISQLEEKERRGEIHSPFSGRVLEVMVGPGDYVSPGTPLVWMEYSGESATKHLVYGYAPVNLAKQLELGAEVRISFSQREKQDYGSLVGRVKDISRFAVSPENIAKVVKNSSLVEHLSGGYGAVIQLVIEPLADANTPSGYRWSGGDGPPQAISTGSVGSLKAVIKRVRPIAYILPDLEG
jgi:HlyD family secretion protein